MEEEFWHHKNSKLYSLNFNLKHVHSTQVETLLSRTSCLSYWLGNLHSCSIQSYIKSNTIIILIKYVCIESSLLSTPKSVTLQSQAASIYSRIIIYQFAFNVSCIPLSTTNILTTYQNIPPISKPPPPKKKKVKGEALKHCKCICTFNFFLIAKQLSISFCNLKTGTTCKQHSTFILFTIACQYWYLLF